MLSDWKYLHLYNKELKQCQRRWRKTTAKRQWQNNNFARASRFFVHSLHDYDVKVPNFMFFSGREHKATTFFYFPELRYIQSFRIQRQEKFAKIWRIKRDGISANKFEAARSHFLSDVFVVVSVVACVASVSVWFWSKQRGMRVKHRAKMAHFWLSFHFSRCQNRKSPSSVFLGSETKRKRLLRRPVLVA